MTRTVRDAALMLDAIAGPDDRDRFSLPADGGPSFLDSCDAGIAGLSVAWSPDLGHAAVDPEVLDLCAQAARALRVARLPRGSGDAHLGQPRGGLPRDGRGGDATRPGATASMTARPSSTGAWSRSSTSGAGSRSSSTCAPRTRGTTSGPTCSASSRASTSSSRRRSRCRRSRSDGPASRRSRAARSAARLDPVHLSVQPHGAAGGHASLSASPRRDCRWGFRSSGGAMGTGRVLAASAAFEAAAPWADRKPPLD